MQKVSSATLAVWRWQIVGASAIFAAFTTVLLLQGVAFPFALAPLLVGTIVVAIGWMAAGAYYNRLEYEIDAAGIVIRSGIFWRSTVLLPRIRVQHTDVSQGPLQRRFAVATLTFYTAGSAYTKIELPGLAYDDATALRDTLIAQDGSGV